MPDYYDVWLPRIGVVMIGLIGASAALSAFVFITHGQMVPCEISNMGVSAASTLGTVVIALTGRNNGRS